MQSERVLLQDRRTFSPELQNTWVTSARSTDTYILKHIYFTLTYIFTLFLSCFNASKLVLTYNSLVHFITILTWADLFITFMRNNMTHSSSNPNQTHLNKLIKVFRINRKLQAGEFLSEPPRGPEPLTYKISMCEKCQHLNLSQTHC